MFRKILKYKKSFSQVGEDMIIDFLFSALGIKNPNYIDVGAHDPFHYSNTAYFYAGGARGINIEPDPVLFNRINRKRKRDINLNIGIGEANGVMDFYVMNAPTMNTFSKEQAETLVREEGFKISKVIPVEVKPLRDVIEVYCNGTFPHLLSLDAEGMDFSILNQIDFEANYPKVICLETVEYSSKLMEGNKEKKLITYLQEKGYKVFADTYINTIFVRLDCL